MTDSLIISVIAAHDNTVIEPVVRRIRREFASSGEVGETVWLSQKRACDIPFTSHSPELRQLLMQTFVSTSDGIDVNVMDAANRRKKLLIADMDSTIIDCECLDELADLAGLKPQISAITERAMQGEIAFEPALRERVAMLKGLAMDALERTYETRVKLNPGAKALVTTMKKHGARTCLVSGGVTYFTQRVAKDAGFDDNQANVLLDDGMRLTGEVREPILGREAKLTALKTEIENLKISPDDAIAIGDGANDLAMIQYAGLGVAYHAKPIVADAAGASIKYGDLRAALYLQGYSDNEIVDA